MTLHEIEKTLQTLIARNKDLTEEKLKTLLQAGGWEENTIEEGLFLFNNFNKAKSVGVLDVGKSTEEKRKDNVVKEIKSVENTSNELALLENSEGYIYPIEYKKNAVISEEPVFSLIEEDLKELNNNNIDQEILRDKKHLEEESLIKELSDKDLDNDQLFASKDLEKEPLPHNLPLVPFETSKISVPFYKYRKLFTRGDKLEEKKENKISETINTEEVFNNADPNKNIDINNEDKITELDASVALDNNEKLKINNLLETKVDKNELKLEEVEKKIEKIEKDSLKEEKVDIISSQERHENEKYKETEPAHIDAKLVLVTAGMLIVILLLLGYMYSNGRL